MVADNGPASLVVFVAHVLQKAPISTERLAPPNQSDPTHRMGGVVR